MNNPEKLATQCTKDDEKHSKNKTHYVLDTTTHKQNTLCTGHYYTQTKHTMYWTLLHKNKTHYVLDTTTHKQNTLCTGHYYTQTKHTMYWTLLHKTKHK
jgi:hypothetical protein